MWGRKQEALRLPSPTDGVQHSLFVLLLLRYTHV